MTKKTQHIALCAMALATILMLLVAVGCGNVRQKNATGAKHGSEKYQKVRLVLTTSGTATGIDTLVANRIAETVREASNGAIVIEVYDNDRLAGGNTTQGVQMIADGSVDIAVYASGTLSKLDRRMAIAALPWTFADYQTARRVIDETGGNFYEKILAQQGLHFLGSTHNGMRQLSNNKHQVATPGDLTGLKIRILGNADARHFFRLYDAVPMPMSRSEIPTALEQGIIDGNDTTIFQLDSFNLLKEQIKFLTDWHYAYENYIFVANSKSYDRLDDKTRMLISAKTRAACDWGRDLLEEREQSIVEKLVADGVIIKKLNEEELHKFQTMAKPLTEQLKKFYGQEACDAFQIPYE